MEYKFSSVAELAAEAGISTDAFWSVFTVEHQVDMVQLGWSPKARLIPPAVVRYIKEVVFERKPRLKVFPDLKTLA